MDVPAMRHNIDQYYCIKLTLTIVVKSYFSNQVIENSCHNQSHIKWE